MHTFCFLRTKPRLSQAGALLLPKDFVSLGNKNFTMTKIHFRSYNPNQTVLFPQRIDEDIAEHDPVRMVDALVERKVCRNTRCAFFYNFAILNQNINYATKYYKQFLSPYKYGHTDTR